MKARPQRDAPAPPPAPLPVRLLEGLALAIILVVAVGRTFLAEQSFRTDRVIAGSAAAGYGPPEELIRVSCTVILLAAAALWALAQAFRRQRRLRGAVPAVGLLAGAGLVLAGSLEAVDVRAALLGWGEQASILLAALVVLQLVAADCRRWPLLLAVIAALGAAMGAKAISQAIVENPMAVEMFEEDPAAQLAIAGLRPGTPQARLFESRLRDPAATGFAGLSNVTASLLVMALAAAVGLAAEKIAHARADRRRHPPAGSDVHLPTLGAVMAVGLAVLAALGLLLTRSKGGIAAALLAAVGAVVVARKRAALARHRRAALAAAAVAAVVVLVAAVVVGSASGTLPGGESMKIRWEYWAGSAGVIEDAPLLGTGPGNFSHDYLPHRLPASAESPKTAHNVIVDAACAFGLPAAAGYLVLLAWALAAMTRPAPAPADDETPPDKVGNIWWCFALALTAGVARLIWVGTEEEALILLEGVFPAGVFFVALLTALWVGRRLDVSALAGPAGRLAIGAGLAGFVAHNMLTYSIFRPATATVFWVTAGAAVGAGAVRGRKLPRAWGVLVAVAVAIVLTVAAVGAGLWLWLPVYRRNARLIAAEAAYAENDRAELFAQLDEAIAADPHDGYAAANAARIFLIGPTVSKVDPLAAAVEYAGIAWERMPTAGHAALLADALWYQAEPSEWLLSWRGPSGDLEAIEATYERAIERMPESWMHASALAEVYVLRGSPQKAYKVLARAANAPRAAAEPKLYDHLGDAAWAAGMKPPARDAWRKYARLSAEKAHPVLRRRALEMAERAFRLDPMNLRRRGDYVRMLLAAGRRAEAAGHVEECLRIDSQRPPDSDVRLSRWELAALEMLREKIRAVGEAETTSRPATMPATRSARP